MFFGELVSNGLRSHLTLQQVIFYTGLKNNADNQVAKYLNAFTNIGNKNFENMLTWDLY